jgi:hypothetical protein
VSETPAILVLAAGAAYLGIGCVVAIALSFRGLARIDSTAHHAPWGFRLIVLPGLTALWPWVLRQWSRNTGSAPHDA